MEHYVCRGGCGGSSDKPDVCHTQDCPNNEKPFGQCSCEDGQHGVVSENKMAPEQQGHDVPEVPPTQDVPAPDAETPAEEKQE